CARTAYYEADYGYYPNRFDVW
nr:immunoglobulin heavy chain junction region [Macaca mulatta]MOV53614.1 immunoglobulin heavy chain junction region [Macaca mulatta]MOV54013.1 immunoglobulin heavy chain junction region [Macaca mulatta]MOV54183.1 immunoglobulin heavy chain junction region [Macaca mulatta]MOV54330.1 immunoglobulin heavy chain junction region [Macaca mulatta]